MAIQEKFKILFVCLGNICRSPAAHGMMESLIAKKGLEHLFEIDSAGTYAGHQGELPDARMRAHARRRGLELTHPSRPVRSDDFDYFDLIVAMDDRNFTNLKDMAPDLESEQKIHRMVEYGTDIAYDYIPDPYYSGADGFELVLDLLENTCAGLLDKLQHDLA